MSHPNPREVITTQALGIWVAAMAVYLVAITGRTSFGVAGLDAIERFDVDAGRIAVFTSVQLGVYALAQIPTGILIDKFGPRLLLVVGAVIMGIGQVVLGLYHQLWRSHCRARAHRRGRCHGISLRDAHPALLVPTAPYPPCSPR